MWTSRALQILEVSRSGSSKSGAPNMGDIRTPDDGKRPWGSLSIAGASAYRRVCWGVLWAGQSGFAKICRLERAQVGAIFGYFGMRVWELGRTFGRRQEGQHQQHRWTLVSRLYGAGRKRFPFWRNRGSCLPEAVKRRPEDVHDAGRRAWHHQHHRAPVSHTWQ